ncbi:MAG: zinc-dependent metalloprotease, partial [Acidobacteriota bacterium]
DDENNDRDRPRRGADRDEGGIKPYDKVITEEAQSDEGLFTVHKIKEKYFYEIPESELDRDFLWVSRIAKTTLGIGYGGQRLGNRVVRWQRRGDNILLRNVSYSIVADKELPIAQAVESANNDTIIQVFPIRALSPEGAPVIEVTPLFAAEVAEFSARSRLQARAMDKKRSFVDQILSFPRNIEVRATHTYTKPPDNNRTPGRPQPQARSRRGMPAGSATVVLHFSMLKLPEKPMMPRLYDERVGYFSMRQTDFGRDEHKAVQRRFITRWRLEKKDPAAELSEPVQPIVYWIDPATPEKWVPYVKKGVEKWQAAFEAAGFKRAIIAREAPSPQVDPDWHPEDARYSVIRWLPSDVENASGPHVHDPRSGEILESDIQFYHNVQNLLRSWYFLQAAPLDPRARKLPFPDDLMGALLEYVVAHEVGHTLGFRHNMKASSTYPLEKIRDPQWVAAMGHTPTLMDYSRFNYVAQPEDGIAVEDLIPKIGPYDKWATMWGYKPIPEAGSADEEKETLDHWIREQDSKPWLRFSTAGARGSDPGELTEAVGDADAVQATALGLKNLKRVADLLLEASTEPGENWDDLEELYGRLLGQWVREMVHVTALVGGFYSQQKHAGQEGVRFEPVPRDRQAEALRFLNQHAFSKPEFLIRPEILRRIEPSGVLARIGNSQRRVL